MRRADYRPDIPGRKVYCLPGGVKTPDRALKNSRLSSSPSRSWMRGSHCRSVRARVMSGRRRVGSSCGNGKIKRGNDKELVAKGIHFARLTLTREGLWDMSRVEGLPRLSLLSTGSNNPRD